MRYVVRFSRYISSSVADYREAGSAWTLRACAGARRSILDVRAALPVPRWAHECAWEGLAPEPGGLAYRLASEGRQYLLEVEPTSTENGRLAVLGVFAEAGRADGGWPGMATVVDGRIVLQPHPGVREALSTTSGGGTAVVFLASLEPHHPPLAVPVHGVVYLIHPNPARVEEVSRAELLARLSPPAVTEL